jgi:hypothetical protein
LHTNTSKRENYTVKKMEKIKSERVYTCVDEILLVVVIVAIVKATRPIGLQRER